MILKRTVIVIFFNIFLFGTELKLPIKVREKGDIIFYDKKEVDLAENLFYNGNEKKINLKKGNGTVLYFYKKKKIRKDVYISAIFDKSYVKIKDSNLFLESSKLVYGFRKTIIYNKKKEYIFNYKGKYLISIIKKDKNGKYINIFTGKCDLLNYFSLEEYHISDNQCTDILKILSQIK